MESRFEYSDSDSGSESSHCEKMRLAPGDTRANFTAASDRLKTAVSAIHAHIKSTRVTTNHNKTKMIFARIPAQVEIQPLDSKTIKECVGSTIASLYVFKLRFTHINGWTHGVYLSMNGFCQRRLICTFIKSLLESLARGHEERLDMIVVKPRIAKTLSVFDYVQSLYGTHRNLIVTFQPYTDAICQKGTEELPEHRRVRDTIHYLRDEAQMIMDNMMAAPAFYKKSTLWKILCMTQAIFRDTMRMTSIATIHQAIGKDAYTMALQHASIPNGTSKSEEDLLHHSIQRSVVNRLTTDQSFMRLQRLLAQYFGDAFIHPHPFISLHESVLGDLPALEGMLLNPKFMLPVLLTARWFRQVCMQKTEHISNNRANLVLYGMSGAGKTLIASALSQFIPTYKYLQTGHFQNPDIMNKALMYFEEMDTTQLTSNHYKALLDIKSTVKMDFKNAHPESVTEGMPSIICTNDGLLQSIMGVTGRQSKFGDSGRGRSATQFNEQSIQAAVRRLYIVPMHGGVYGKLHGPMEAVTKLHGENRLRSYELCAPFDSKFGQEPQFLGRLFNLIFALACVTTRQGSWAADNEDQKVVPFIPPQLKDYVQLLLDKFSKTLWFGFFKDNHEFVIDQLERIEELMGKQEVSDTDMIKACFEASHGLERKAVKFLVSECKAAQDPALEGYATVFKDSQGAWPQKIYFVKQSIPLTSRQWRHGLAHALYFVHPALQMVINDSTFDPFKILDQMNMFEEIAIDDDSDSGWSLGNEIADMFKTPVGHRYDEVEGLLQSCLGKRKRSLSQTSCEVEEMPARYKQIARDDSKLNGGPMPSDKDTGAE